MSEYSDDASSPNHTCSTFIRHSPTPRIRPWIRIHWATPICTRTSIYIHRSWMKRRPRFVFGRRVYKMLECALYGQSKVSYQTWISISIFVYLNSYNFFSLRAKIIMLVLHCVTKFVTPITQFFFFANFDIHLKNAPNCQEILKISKKTI